MTYPASPRALGWRPSTLLAGLWVPPRPVVADVPEPPLPRTGHQRRPGDDVTWCGRDAGRVALAETCAAANCKQCKMAKAASERSEG